MTLTDLDVLQGPDEGYVIGQRGVLALVGHLRGRGRRQGEEQGEAGGRQGPAAQAWVWGVGGVRWAVSTRCARAVVARCCVPALLQCSAGGPAAPTVGVWFTQLHIWHCPGVSRAAPAPPFAPPRWRAADGEFKLQSRYSSFAGYSCLPGQQSNLYHSPRGFTVPLPPISLGCCYARGDRMILCCRGCRCASPVDPISMFDIRSLLYP